MILTFKRTNKPDIYTTIDTNDIIAVESIFPYKISCYSYTLNFILHLKYGVTFDVHRKTNFYFIKDNTYAEKKEGSGILYQKENNEFEPVDDLVEYKELKNLNDLLLVQMKYKGNADIFYEENEEI